MIKILIGAILIVLVMFFVCLIFLHETQKDHTQYPRNYEVRFDPESEKYYIVNHVINESIDVEVRSSWGNRLYYPDITKAQYVCDTMNSK